MAYKNYRVSLFCIVTCLFWFSLYTYVPILPTYAESLGSSYRMIGLIIGSYGFAQMLLRIPLGILSDKLNRRKLFIIIGTAISLASGLGFWYFPGVMPALFSRFLSGVAAAAWVTFAVLFSSYFESREAPKAIGFINSLNSVGQMTAIFLGGLAAQSFGLRSTFMLGSLGALTALMLSSGITENKAVRQEPVKTAELLAVVKEVEFQLICLLAVFCQFIAFATVYGFTPVAAKQIGATSFQLGLLTSLSTLPGIFASALSGSFFSKRYGEKKTVVWGFIIVSLTCMVIPFTKNINILFVSQVIGGFGRGLTFPVLMGLSIKNVQENRRATAMGFFQAIYSIGMFLGPVLVGLLNSLAGLNWGFIATGMVGMLGALIMASKDSCVKRIRKN